MAHHTEGLEEALGRVAVLQIDDGGALNSDQDALKGAGDLQPKTDARRKHDKTPRRSQGGDSWKSEDAGDSGNG